MAVFQDESHSEQLLGIWSKLGSFQLEMGANAMVNYIERYTFKQDGTGTHSYKDDSELPTQDTFCEFEFYVEHNQIVFQSSGSFYDYAAIDFKMNGNELTFDYNGVEEVYIKERSYTADV
ncbi:hypothetical protein BN938_1004 [Mucinivorans hirudinis]|uniref:Lipocalin-like domain-containing protein n=1 Tax=Mucinivorans hirudinis TaxID=1433126 RepID=A0A060R7E1_9BACT|nr:hypothetical protein BN938_1004 [Mucinivorans hirudinis]